MTGTGGRWTQNREKKNRKQKKKKNELVERTGFFLCSLFVNNHTANNEKGKRRKHLQGLDERHRHPKPVKLRPHVQCHQEKCPVFEKHKSQKWAQGERGRSKSLVSKTETQRRVEGSRTNLTEEVPERGAAIRSSLISFKG